MGAGLGPYILNNVGGAQNQGFSSALTGAEPGATVNFNYWEFPPNEVCGLEVVDPTYNYKLVYYSFCPEAIGVATDREWVIDYPMTGQMQYPEVIRHQFAKNLCAGSSDQRRFDIETRLGK